MASFDQSDKPADHDYTFENMKAMLDEIVRELLRNEEKITIVAHDIGGPAALLYASEQPDRISRLVILNTLFYDYHTPLDKLGHITFELLIINRIQMSDFGLGRLMRNLIKNKNAHGQQAITEILKGHQPWPWSLRRKTIVEPRQKEGQAIARSLARIFKALPVEKHLVIGKEDPLCYEHMRRIYEENPDVPAHFLEKCGHFVSLDQPDALNEILEGILQSDKVNAQYPPQRGL